MGRTNMNIKARSLNVLLWGVVALIVMNLLDRFGIYNLTGFQPDIITLIAISFVAIDTGIRAAITRRKKIGVARWFMGIIAIVAFVSLLLGWLGMNVAILNTWKGTIELALLISVVIEIFK